MGTVIGLPESYIANDAAAPAGCRFSDSPFDALIEPAELANRRNRNGPRKRACTQEMQ
jgi:hypothetical protein